jgi:hypothetical protein
VRSCLPGVRLGVGLCPSGLGLRIGNRGAAVRLGFALEPPLVAGGFRMIGSTRLPRPVTMRNGASLPRRLNPVISSASLGAGTCQNSMIHFLS